MESSLTDMIEGKAEELRLAMLGNNGILLMASSPGSFYGATPMLTSRLELNAWRTFPSVFSYSRC